MRAPLDFIVGTQGSVRVLRVLSATEVPLSQAELARRASLSLSGLPSLLTTLGAAGIIDYVGRGRTRQVRLRGHPLTSALRQLFRDEADRWRRVQQMLGVTVGTIAEKLISAWIEGPVTIERDTFGDSISVGMLSERPLPIALQESIRKSCNNVQSTQHVVISLRFHQRADLLRFANERRTALARAITLYGPAPLDLLEAAQHEARSRGKAGSKPHKSMPTQKGRPTSKAIAKRIAERIVQEPEIISSAHEYIERRLPLAGEIERLAIIEWQGLLESLTAGQIASLLREDSERADVLRQNLPFLGAFSEEERAQMFPSARAVGRRET